MRKTIIFVLCISVFVGAAFSMQAKDLHLDICAHPQSCTPASPYEIILNYKGETFSLKLPACASSSNFELLAQSRKWGRDGNHEEALFALSTLINMGVPKSRAFEFLFPTINRQVDEILARVNVLPRNSKIRFTPNFSQKFWASREQSGLMINKETLFSEIYEKFRKSKQVAVCMRADVVAADVTREDNLACTRLLSRFSTSIESSTAERQNNVRLALRQFNGMVVQPNAEVSFNATTGRRTEARGYKTAHVISNGLFVDGVGGGVCQASTTLYNALLLADNIEILEANRHSMPVSYVTLGFDAMVAYGSSDLRFKNTGATPIFIRTYFEGGRVYVEVYGKVLREGLRKVRRCEKIRVIGHGGDEVKADNGEFAHLIGEDGYYRLKRAQDGVEVQTYLDVYDGDKLIESRAVRHTTYPPQRGILVGA